MKLVLAIVNHDDANAVIQTLIRQGFSATRLATTGGLLLAENVTVLVGVDEEKVDEVVEAIRLQSHSRREAVPSTAQAELYPGMEEVAVGGATIFVVDVERFERI